MPIPIVEVDTFLKQLGQGTSGPMLILANDNQKYILKTQTAEENGQRQLLNCMFMNEVLVYQIAKYLGVPIPDIAFAKVDGDHLQNGPSLRFVHRFHEGMFFASKEVVGNEENVIEGYQKLIQMNKPYIRKSWNSFFGNLKNGATIPRIIAMDFLIANFDRFTNLGNLLVALENDERVIYAIDHGHSFFGPIWNFEKMMELRRTLEVQEYIGRHVGILINVGQRTGRAFSGLGDIFKAIEGYIDLTDLEAHSFRDVVERIEEIDEEIIDSWFQEIPDEWYVDKTSQVSEHKNYLLNRKEYVKILIQTLAEHSAFSNYRGGVLKWKERHVGTV